jgi:hypothetical protein
MGATDDQARAQTGAEPSLVAWEPPRVVRLNALPDVLGACIPGSTNYETGSNCRNGSDPRKHCRTGYAV